MRAGAVGKCLHVGDEGERGGASRWADEADPRAGDFRHDDGQQEVRDAALYGYAGLLGFVLQSLGYQSITSSATM